MGVTFCSERENEEKDEQKKLDKPARIKRSNITTSYRDYCVNAESPDNSVKSWVEVCRKREEVLTLINLGTQCSG